MPKLELLLDIYFSFQQRENFENPLRIDKVIPLVWCTPFWDTVYMHRIDKLGV